MSSKNKMWIFVLIILVTSICIFGLFKITKLRNTKTEKKEETKYNEFKPIAFVLSYKNKLDQ